MKSKKNIVFLGMMGSGKTSIGRSVSKKLNLDFFDIDEHIEAKLGMKISKIFEYKGEPYFRKLEEKISLKVLKLNRIVVSLGGGAFLNKNIRDEILNKHMSFWLKWDDKILLKRIKNNPKRPIAFQSTSQELIDLIKLRSNIYSKALYKIKCDNLNKLKVVEKVLKIYENN
jgi:shikimate kinase